MQARYVHPEQEKPPAFHDKQLSLAYHARSPLCLVYKDLLYISVLKPMRLPVMEECQQ